MPDTVQQPDPEVTTPVAESAPAAQGAKDKKGKRRSKSDPKALKADKPKRRSMFEDRRVKFMAIGVGGLVLIYLVVIIAALLMGVLANDQPQTMAERDLRLYRTSVENGSTEEKDWAGLAEALISVGNYREAQQTIDRANEIGIADPQHRGLYAAQARLYFETEQYEECVETADATVEMMLKQGKDDYEATLAGGSPTLLGASQWPDTFWQSMLLVASGHEALGDDEATIEALTRYLEMRPVASDALEWRGDVYARMGKTSEAREDYETAIQFFAPGEQRDEFQKKIDDLGSN